MWLPLCGVDPPALATPFHVVDVIRPIPLVIGARRGTAADIRRRLAATGLPVVVFLGHGDEATTDATDDAFDEVACAVGAPKTIGGWDERDSIAISIMAGEATVDFTVAGRFASGAWSFVVQRR